MKTVAGSARLFSKCSYVPHFAAIIALVGAALFVEHAAANPWVPTGSTFAPAPSNLVPSPKLVPGKDFSDVRDRQDVVPLPDPEQVVAWDGSGGVRNSFDYTGTQVPPVASTVPLEVDGIAAGGDALFHAVRDNQAALLFSVETDPRIMFERETGLPASPAGFGVWATATDIDAMNPPLDTDGIEVWGGDQNDDSDRYSLIGDPFVPFPAGARKVAVWQFTPAAGPSTPHTFTSDLAASMDMQFGGPGNGPIFGQLVELMDVDAIMTFGTQVTFSIRPLTIQIGGPAPIIFVFDGGEIFEYDGPGIATRYLNHGGHLWDTAFPVMTTFGLQHENVDGLEAVAGIPEPSTLMLLGLGLLAVPRFVRRRA
jgi:hypothetical protein